MATKEDIKNSEARVKSQINDLESRIKGQIVRLENRFEAEFVKVHSEIKNLELKMTVKLGVIVTVAMGAIATFFKFFI